MNTDEMRRQKVDLTIQVEDSQIKLNALRAKAAGIGDKLADYAKWLRDTPHTHIYRDGMSSHYKQNIDAITPLGDTYVRALELKPMLELADEIRKEMWNVRTLKERLDRL